MDNTGRKADILFERFDEFSYMVYLDDDYFIIAHIQRFEGVVSFEKRSSYRMLNIDHRYNPKTVINSLSESLCGKFSKKVMVVNNYL